ncbi:GNAT family N-acetyltransferase [Calothrix sp. 336/3]|uniref:GNAT family N-acetyltransferase n=1 Tax=Calothrix sp. 336/3 TaxID=1337936 RepID=UPI0004E2AF15|nr:GNAT family N-acetyltransferase [Calothrix sp. 336/3]AKG20657.1 hypothetical protein IJ00_04420 [Calothrix sp. 336/3]
MDIQIISADKLTKEHLSVWSYIQQNNPLLGSPYFSPEYTSIVAEAKGDVLVAIIKDAGEIVGFFPFEKNSWPIARPVAWQIADYQTLVLKSGFNFDIREFVESCNLKIWNFCNMPNTILPEQQFHKLREEPSYIIDVSAGYDSYIEERNLRSDWIKKTIKMMRKVERDLGEIRFVPQLDDESVLNLMMRWKSEQYARMNTYDRFQIDWLKQVVEKVYATRNERFEGMLSALYIGDQVAGIEFGMRTPSVLHSWFSIYNQDFYKYSPGMILQLKIIEYVASQGMKHIDIGAGTDNYKERVANNSITICHGYIEIPSVITTVRNLRNRSMEMLNSVKTLVTA